MASELSRLIDEELIKQENGQAKGERPHFPTPHRLKDLQKARASHVPESTYFTPRRIVSIFFFCAILLGTIFVVLKGTANTYKYPSGASWLIGGSADGISGMPEVEEQVGVAVEDATPSLTPQEGISGDQLDISDQRESTSEEQLPEAEPVVGDTKMAAEAEEILRLQVQEAAAESEQGSSNLDDSQQPPATEQKQSIAKLSPALKRIHRHKHKYVSPSSLGQGVQRDIEEANEPQEALQAESSPAGLAALANPEDAAEDEAADVETAPPLENLLPNEEVVDQQIVEGALEEQLADDTRLEVQPAAGDFDEEQAEGIYVKHQSKWPEEEAGSQDPAVLEPASEPAAGGLDEILGLSEEETEEEADLAAEEAELAEEKAELAEEEAELAEEEAELADKEAELAQEETDVPETAYSEADEVDHVGGAQLAAGEDEVQLENSPPEPEFGSVPEEDLSWVSSEGVEPLPDIPAAEEQEGEEHITSEVEPSIREKQMGKKEARRITAMMTSFSTEPKMRIRRHFCSVGESF